MFLKQPLKISENVMIWITKGFQIISVIAFSKALASSFMLKSFLVKKLSKRYEKYEVYGEDKKAIDYVINKLLIGLLFVLLVIFQLINTFQVKNI